MLVGHLFVNTFTLDPDERLSHAARTPSRWGVMEEPNHTNLMAKLDMTSLAVHLPKMAEKWHTNRIQQKKNIVLILSLESFASKLLRGPGPTQEMVGNWPTRARPEPRLQNDVVRHVTGLFEPPVCLWFCMCFCLFRGDLKFFDSFWNSLYSVELPCQSQHLMVTSRWVEAVEASN